jgi:putative FmdB family regulatory protein
MPIYEFQCQSCGNQVEVLQKISDDPLTDCEACGKSEMKKMVSAAAFRLSGSGWYETDFKSGNKKNLTESASKESKKTDKKDNKSDIKKSSNDTKKTTSSSNKT